MRDLLLLTVVVLTVFLALRNQFVAYLAWGWTGVLSPVFLMYGFMGGARLNLIFALLGLFLVLVRREELVAFKPNFATSLLLVFFAHASVSALFALPNNPFNAQYYEVFAKSLVFALLMPMLVYSRQRMHALVVLIVLAMSLGAVIEGLKSLSTFGAHQVRGLGLNMLSDNNHFAAGVLVVLPLAVYAAQYSKHRFVSQGFWAVAAVFAFCILGSRSRGAFVGLLAMLIVMLLFSKKKLGLITVAGIVFFVFTGFFSEGIFDRLSTIKEADEDSSFLHRVNAWRVATAVALSNPIFGGGFHAQQAQAVWQQFMLEPGLLGWLTLPEPEASARAAHSIYFEVLGDLGFMGLALFLTLIIHALRSLARTQQMARQQAQLSWAGDLAVTLMLCLVGYAVAGAFVSLAYMELFYMIIMAAETLRQLVIREIDRSTEVRT